MARLAVGLLLSLSMFLGAARAALISTGADGVLDPAADYTLPFRGDGLFNFSRIVVGPGLTLGFDPAQTSATLLSLEDILVGGTVNALSLGSLTLSTPAHIALSGAVLLGSGTLVLEAASATLGGTTAVTLMVPARPPTTLLPGGTITVAEGSSGGSLTTTAGGNLALQPAPGSTVLGSGTIVLSGTGSISGDGRIVAGTGSLSGSGTGAGPTITLTEVAAVPLPGALWLACAGLALLFPAGLRKARTGSGQSDKP